jgi:hypothetical protein
MKGLHRDEAVGGQDRGVKEDREKQLQILLIRIRMLMFANSMSINETVKKL